MERHAPLATTFVNTEAVDGRYSAVLLCGSGNGDDNRNYASAGRRDHQAITFSVGPTISPVPHISSLSPSGVLTGGGGFTLRVFGSNFVQQSTVAVNGSNRQSGFVNSTEIDASLNSTDIATARSPAGYGYKSRESSTGGRLFEFVSAERIESASDSNGCRSR